jgi:mannose-6-phosphate isomerase-like protein (cupin superfamily)
MNSIIRHVGDYRWDGVPVLNYKENGTHFKAISRQILFEGGPKLQTQLRYFEIESGGHSTLERHDHIHSVMIIRGRGHCLVGDAIYEITGNDLVYVPTMTWHQFRATTSEPLGFLCLVMWTATVPSGQMRRIRQRCWRCPRWVSLFDFNQPVILRTKTLRAFYVGINLSIPKVHEEHVEGSASGKFSQFHGSRFFDSDELP